MICQSPEKRRTRSYVQRPELTTALGHAPPTLRAEASTGRNRAKQHRVADDGRAQIEKCLVQSGCASSATDDAGRGIAEELGYVICRANRREQDRELLAQCHQGTKKRVRRFANATRLRRIMELPLEFIPNAQFLEADAERTILAETPGVDLATRPPKLPSRLPSYLASMYEVPLLTREQEAHLFRKFNYLKYKASQLRSQLESTRAKQRLLDKIEGLYEAAVVVKNHILRANLRLVVSIAKRYVRPGNDLWELISDGNVSLIRAVEKFDFARGNKVSTYASWAIMRNFARTIPTEQRHQDRFRTSHPETLSSSQEHRSDPQEQETAQRQRVAQVEKLLSRLDEREQMIVMRRFGLLPGQEPQSLEEIGAEMGVSKERIRQIQTRALNKLRVAAAEEHIEMPGVV
jgi:RNA polymerase primary sigma factor